MGDEIIQTYMKKTIGKKGKYDEKLFEKTKKESV